MKDQVVIESHDDGFRKSLVFYINGTLINHAGSLSTYSHRDFGYYQSDVTFTIEDADVTIKEYYKGREVIPTCRTI